MFEKAWSTMPEYAMLDTSMVSLKLSTISAASMSIEKLTSSGLVVSSV